MPKIKIRVLIKNSETESSLDTMAILEEDKIKYKEDKNTTVIWNYKDNTLLRETDQLRITYKFQEQKKTEGIIEIKEYNQNIKVEIHTKKLERKKNNIKLEFKIEQDEFLYCIEELL